MSSEFTLINECQYITELPAAAYTGKKIKTHSQ